MTKEGRDTADQVNLATADLTEQIHIISHVAPLWKASHLVCFVPSACNMC